jgi:hypothetical protein
MRRWVFAFLLFVVPFQLVWGAAAPYCAHETGVSTKKHFGHHEHKHQADTCHLGCSAFMPAATSAVDALPHGDAMRRPEPRYDSHIPASPLRPDRAHSTPAARFGGDVVMVSLAD